MFKFIFLIYILVKSTEAGCYLAQSKEECITSMRSFYDFGPAAGDHALPKLDDHFELVKTPGKFKFYDHFYSYFYLSTNGFIELKEKNENFKMHEKFNFNSAPFPIAGHAIIAPFWADHVPELHGDIFYRFITDLDSMDQISRDINSFKPSKFVADFIPNWASVITWFQIKSHPHRRFVYKNSFQLVLTSDGETSYIMFNYGDLQWPNKVVNVSVQIGYNSGDNKTFLEIRESPNLRVVDLKHSSNVDLRSRWMYRVDSHENRLESQKIKERVEEAKKSGPKWLNFLIFLIALVGIISIFNTAMWAGILLKNRNFPSFPSPFNYRRQLSESKSALSQDC